MSPPRRPCRVLIVAFEGAQSLDITGPAEVFAVAAQQLGQPAYRVRLLGQGGWLRTGSGLALRTTPLSKVSPRPSDTVLVSGGGEGAVRAALGDEGLRRWLQRASGVVGRLGSVCSGAFVLAGAGLLDGRRAATHWSACERLAAYRPGVAVDRNAIFVQDGALWTSAGVTTGIDMALAMVEQDHGARLADRVAAQLVLYARRPGFQSQFSDALVAQMATSEPLAALIARARARLRQLDVGRLARLAALSPRTLHRRCVEHLRLTPAKLIERLRVEQARTLLTTTDRPAKTIAAESGFGSADRMRRAFERELGVGPHEVRLLFRRGGLARPAPRGRVIAWRHDQRGRDAPRPGGRPGRRGSAGGPDRVLAGGRGDAGAVPAGVAVPPGARARRVRVRGGVLHVLRGLRDQRPALRRHVPAVLQGREAAGAGRRLRAGAAGALLGGRVRGAAGAGGVGGLGAGPGLGAVAGVADPADVLAGGLALRQAGLRRAGGAVGAPRRSLQPGRAPGVLAAQLRQLGLRLGQPRRPGQAGRGEGRGLHLARPRARARAGHAGRVRAQRAGAGLGAGAEAPARRAAAAAGAAGGLLDHPLAMDDLHQHRPADDLHDPGAALGAIPLFRLAAAAQPGARGRGAALVRAPCQRAAGAAGGVGAGPGLAVVPRGAGVARRAARRPYPARRPAVERPGPHPLFRRHLRLREHPPLLHG